MTDDELLLKVKQALNIGGSYQDNTLQIYIDEVKAYIIGAGVNEDKVNSYVGVISRGVADLWNYGSGEAKLSNYFMQRVAQIVINGADDTEV